jgi:hypothetical protein
MHGRIFYFLINTAGPMTMHGLFNHLLKPLPLKISNIFIFFQLRIYACSLDWITNVGKFKIFTFEKHWILSVPSELSSTVFPLTVHSVSAAVSSKMTDETHDIMAREVIKLLLVVLDSWLATDTNWLLGIPLCSLKILRIYYKGGCLQ